MLNAMPIASKRRIAIDGRTLATIGNGGEVQLWNSVSRTRVKIFRQAVRSLGPLAFSPDGKTLVGGDDDGNVHFWNVASGNIIATLPAHTATCRSISFSPDGSCLATAEVADTIKLRQDSKRSTVPLQRPRRAELAFALATGG